MTIHGPVSSSALTSAVGVADGGSGAGVRSSLSIIFPVGGARGSGLGECVAEGVAIRVGRGGGVKPLVLASAVGLCREPTEQAAARRENAVQARMVRFIGNTSPSSEGMWDIMASPAPIRQHETQRRDVSDTP